VPQPGNINADTSGDPASGTLHPPVRTRTTLDGWRRPQKQKTHEAHSPATRQRPEDAEELRKSAPRGGSAAASVLILSFVKFRLGLKTIRAF
jgi:hypothetical protein